ncbi:hypothetical protein B0H19DRAFT_1253803 [Mycena capillaripes]|nr:hypothetical protein B0H19DRAFT_1253803 [Mycena capillaripes]
MTFEEMVPDTRDLARDSRYWCLPPVRDQPADVQGNQMYLVTQGIKVGIWYNWTTAKAMVSGYSSGAQRGHRTMTGCIKEWQQHCVLGVHPHPADPRGASQEVRATAGPAKSRARPVEPKLQAELKKYCLPDFSGLTLDAAGQNLRALSEISAPTDSTSISSVATTWPEVPEASRYYAIWGERIVYTDRVEAKAEFLWEEAEGHKPRILSTTDYDEAQAFSEAVYWCD